MYTFYTYNWTFNKYFSIVLQYKVETISFFEDIELAFRNPSEYQISTLFSSQ